MEKRREEAILSTRLELQAASYEEKLMQQSNNLRVSNEILNVGLCLLVMFTEN